MVKHGHEALEDLAEFLTHPGLKPLMAEIQDAVRLMEGDVLRYDLNSGDEKQLIRLKCRAEGAAALYVAICKRVENLKAKQRS